MSNLSHGSIEYRKRIVKPMPGITCFAVDGNAELQVAGRRHLGPVFPPASDVECPCSMPVTFCTL